MSNVFVKPAAGGRIRQPERGYRVMPEDGDHVPRDGFYERLILSGDVVIAEPPKPQQTRPNGRGSQNKET